jgi:hypothetical protein
MNIFNIGDIIIPIEGQKGNIWIVLNVITPAVDSTSYYVLQNLEDQDEVEVLYCNHIEKYYERANE